MSMRRQIASGILLLVLVPGWASRAWADGPGPSLVTVSGHRLLVQKRQPDGSLAAAEPYVIRGVDWAPATSSTTGDDTVRRAEFLNAVATDAPLLESLHINTVRLYLDPGLDAGGLAVLDTLWAHGIMVVLNVDGSRNDITRVQQAVSFYKDHPAILLWMLGSEWNINLYYGKTECNTPLKAAQCTQTAAQLVKSLDTNHPVASSYGEIDINASGLRLADTQNYVNNVCPTVDVWAVNVFRGDSFGTLFDQWRSISTKPMFLGEFGTDAMIHPADLPDETMQAGWDLCLWNHAITELSAIQPSLASLGGLVFEWNDEWWKVPPAGAQNIGGFSNANGHPDGFANEDWFGIVDINRNLRHAATALGEGFESTYRRPPRGLIFGVGSRGTNANQFAGQYGYSRFYQCGRKFYDRSGGGGSGRGLNAVVLDPVTGAQLQAPQNFDTWGTRVACSQNNPSAAMYSLVSYINSAPAGSLIMLSVADDAGINQDLSCNRYSTSSCFEGGLSALEALGSTQIRSYCFRDSWAMIAIKGQGAVAEGRSTNNLVSLQTALPDPGSFSLTLQKTGTGSGSVASDPAGLLCGTSCGSTTASFSTGTLVALNPVASADSVFTGWSGDPDCANGVVTIDMDKSCTARFELLKELTVVKAGTGTGTVTSTPSGINCGTDCAESYAFNTAVTLTATPAAGSRFVGWGGVCTGTGSCVVTMDAARSVSATFNQLVTLTVDVSELNSGVVTSSPAGINCQTHCSATYDMGTVVTLTVSPAGGRRFSSWSGACTGNGVCTVTMDASKQVTATFIRIYTLSSNKAGAGSGTVTSSPAGIDCGTDCTEIYDAGTVVSLTATPASGSRFSGWSPDCPGTGACVVTMTEHKNVTATFVPTYLLTVNKEGSGSGTVSSSPAGINCGADCSETYDANTVVTLTATPAAGSRFVSWSGACIGSGSCFTTMDASKSVTATFVPTYTLTVGKTGAGSGTVSSSPAGISCGVDCSETYDSGTVVTLASTPAAGSRFSGWSGACTGTGSCVVTMDAAKSVTATFVPTYSLTVSKAGSGSGAVTSSPAGIDCGTDCSETYDSGTVVTLTATPAAGSRFSGWSGSCTGSGSCAVTMSAARSVTATFIQTYTLTVSKSGSGSGTVSSSPTGINCGTDCSETYDLNTVVTLTATPAAGSRFSGWSGACTGTGSCAVTMDAAKSVTATFILTYSLTVSKAGSGSGTVTSSPAGIDCGADCSETYDSGTVVTLTAAPAAGSRFSGWSGACTGTGSCVVTMDATKSVTATFVPTYSLTVSKVGSGSGTVTSSPAGIDCGTDCSETYDSGMVVTLTATPAAGVRFSGWSGACTGSGSCVVTMTASRSVTATFVQTYTLTAGKSGSGSGTVSSSPAGINCGADCSEVYDAGTAVSLTATPAVGSGFSGWSGACTGTGSCVVTMDAARSVTAAFDVLSFPLSVSTAGTGVGTVTSSPAGIDCGSDCSENFVFGTSVTLTPAVNPGSRLTGWSGACSGTGGCTVTMDAARSVTATFTAGAFQLDLYTVSPCRILDTRIAGGAITSGTTRVFPVAGVCGIPSDAWAVVINATAISPTGAGEITLFPDDVPAPETGTVHFSAGLTRSNNTTLLLSSGTRSLAARAVVGGGGQVHLAVDVTGYFR